MSIKKSSATAVVNLRGLGIACFNPKKNRCETAILRNGNHKLSVNVYKPAFIDGTGRDTFGYVPVLSREINDLNDVSIEVYGVGNAKIEGFELYQTGEFDRLHGDNDENDIRWILNLEGEEMHNGSLARNERASVAEKPPVTSVFIGNGLFYAVMPTETELAKTPFFRKKNHSEDSEDDFGYIAETMGVNIESDEVILKIAVGTNDEIHKFARVQGCPFKIDIWNVDPDVSADVSDLPVCYQFLTDTSGVEFELTPKSDNGLAGNPVRNRDFCHLVFVDQDSIDNFL